VVILDVLQRLIDFLDQLALAVAGGQLETELFFLGGAVRRIGEVGGLVLHVGLSAVNFFHQYAFPAVQDVSEMGVLTLVHVLLAFLFLVGNKAANQQCVFFFGIAGHRQPHS